MDFIFHNIGIIRSPHTEAVKTPVQPVFCGDTPGTLELKREYIPALKGLEGFSHIFIFYYFDRAAQTLLQLKPFLSDIEQGVFATRAPLRPNKLGMSLVKLTSVEENIVHVSGIDVLDSTPLLDIKPYVQRFDSRENVRCGWQDDVSDDVAQTRGLRNFKS